MIKLSVQLWSVKDATARDFIGTLEAIKKMGYDGVEFAGYGGISAEDMKKELNRIGLEASGTHVGVDALVNNLDEIIEYNKTIGNKYIICPSADVSTKEKCLELNSKFKDIDKKIRENGMIFGFHNHAEEFNVFDGKHAFDYLVENTDMVYELDTFWSEYAGIDTLEYLSKLGKKCPLVHLKDMKIRENGEKVSAPYGTGILDNKAIIEASKKCNPEWFVIEWEEDDMDSLKAIKISIDNLKKLM